MDLLIRGHEKIGQFLRKITSILDIQYFENKIWENDFNIWSLKVLSKMELGGEIDKFKISKLLRLINEQNTTCFANSGLVYESLVLVDQHICQYFNPTNFIYV